MAGGDAEPAGDLLAGVDGTGADLALLGTHPQGPPGVDVRGQALVVDQHAVAAQDVRHEVVGEDRQAVDVLEARDAGEREVGRHELGLLVEAAVVEERHAAGQALGEGHGGAAGLRGEVEGRPLAEEGASARSASAYRLMSSWSWGWPRTPASSSARIARSSAFDQGPWARKRSVTAQATVVAPETAPVPMRCACAVWGTSPSRS